LGGDDDWVFYGVCFEVGHGPAALSGEDYFGEDPHPAPFATRGTHCGEMWLWLRAGEGDGAWRAGYG